MNIGLIDVDSHSGFPNLALMKLAQHHTNIGDNVDWYNIFDQYDIVYQAKVFSFTPDYVYPINNANEVIKGGTGYDIHKQLPIEIDRLQPLYSIYPQINKQTGYGFLTRGCIRKCPWCIVPIKEGKIHPYMDIEEIAIDGRTEFILMDNNILASDYGLEQIEKINKLKYKVDFNQAMDARLVTPEIAQLLAKTKWINYPRFGCDTPAQVEHCEKAIELLRKYGYNGNVMLYTMLHGTPEECYNRLSRWRQAKYKQRITCNAQPMLDLTSKVQHIPQWQIDMAMWAGRRWWYFATDFLDFKCRDIHGRDHLDTSKITQFK